VRSAERGPSGRVTADWVSLVRHAMFRARGRVSRCQRSFLPIALLSGVRSGSPGYRCRACRFRFRDEPGRLLIAFVLRRYADARRTANLAESSSNGSARGRRRAIARSSHLTAAPKSPVSAQAAASVSTQFASFQWVNSHACVAAFRARRPSRICPSQHVAKVQASPWCPNGCDGFRAMSVSYSFTSALGDCCRCQIWARR
jgi:ribosomal protein L34E